jgi:hypothetical protein
MYEQRALLECLLGESIVSEQQEDSYVIVNGTESVDLEMKSAFLYKKKQSRK